MNIWYIKKKKLTKKQKIKKILKDILLAILVPLSLTVSTKFILFYQNTPYKLVCILITGITIFLGSLTITSKLFNKERSNHVFIKDKENRLIYCYLNHNGFNNYNPKKFYEETLNMEENLKEKTKKKSVFYDIATTKEDYINYGQAINQIHSIEEYKNYYEIYFSDPKSNLFFIDAIVVPKNIENIDTLIEELNKIKSLEN